MKKDWFVHVEWVVVLVTLLGGFYTLDTKIANQGSRIDKQGERIDRVYDMWVTTQKDMVKLRKDFQNDIVKIRQDFQKEIIEIHKNHLQD